MATTVYVDAFNLYYGCLRGTPYRWLDLGMPPLSWTP
jgi:6-hydroxy-3-succinoylpyridine 3-monooxygenase